MKIPVESNVSPILKALSSSSAQMTFEKNSAPVIASEYFCQQNLLSYSCSRTSTNFYNPRAAMLTLSVSSPSCAAWITSTLAPPKAARRTANRYDSLQTTAIADSARPNTHYSSCGSMLPSRRRTSLQQEEISPQRQSLESPSSSYLDSWRSQGTSISSDPASGSSQDVCTRRKEIPFTIIFGVLGELATSIMKIAAKRESRRILVHQKTSSFPICSLSTTSNSRSDSSSDSASYPLGLWLSADSQGSIMRIILLIIREFSSRLYNIRMRVLVTVVSVCSYLLIYFIITLLKPPTEDYLFKLQRDSHSALQLLASSDYFPGILPSAGSAQIGDQQGSSLPNLIQLRGEGVCQSDFHMAEIMNSSNCFPLGSLQCRQHKIISRIVNGVTTSFAHHHSLPEVSEGNSKIRPKTNIFQNTDKVNDLLFLYQLTARALKELSPSLLTRPPVSFEDSKDTLTTQLLQNLLYQLSNSSLGPVEKQVQRFMKDPSRARQFVAYFETNAERLRVRCTNSTGSLKQVSLQMEGLKALVKALLGQREDLQSSQAAALLYLFHKLSVSVGEFYSLRPAAGSLDHMEGGFDALQLYYFLGGAVLVMVLLFSQINIKGKVQKQFRHAFPNNRRFKVE